MKNALAAIATLVFASGIAASCGSSSDVQTVAGSPLDAGVDRTMTCGGAGEPCCNGAACDNGFACSAGTCSPGEAVVDAPADVAFVDAPADASGDVVLDASDAVADAAADASSGSCHGGEYKGPFIGTYSSSLELGIPISVTGQVDVTLDPAGRVQSGTIEGVSDTNSGRDAGFGGFPFFCTLVGALDCVTGAFGSWAQCTYCIGPVADGGLGCSLTAGGGTTGVGGHYAGPMTATYDPGTNSLVMGTWNGAEALAGNDGGSPGPDGGPPSNYLSDSGYLGPRNYGGSGTWSATQQ